MKPSSFLHRILPIVAWLVTTGSAGQLSAAEVPSPLLIPRVVPMPNLPKPFAMRDWAQMTRDYVNFVFDFDQRGEQLVMGRPLADIAYFTIQLLVIDTVSEIEKRKT